MDIKEIKYQYHQELDYEYKQFLYKLDIHPHNQNAKKFQWKLLDMFNESMKESLIIVDNIDDLKDDNRQLEEKVEYLEDREDELENEVEDLEKTIQILEDKLNNYEQN